VLNGILVARWRASGSIFVICSDCGCLIGLHGEISAFQARDLDPSRKI
jgi:hypothetical protein